MTEYQGGGWKAGLPNHTQPRSGLWVSVISTLSVVILVAAALYVALGPEPEPRVVSVPAPTEQARVIGTVPEIAAKTVEVAGEVKPGEPANHYAPDGVIAGRATEPEAVAPAVGSQPAKAVPAKTATKKATVVRLSARNKHAKVRHRHRHRHRAVAAARPEPSLFDKFWEEVLGAKIDTGRYRCGKRHATSCIHRGYRESRS